MTEDLLRNLSLPELMQMLKRQVDGSQSVLGMVVATHQYKLPDGALLAIGDFLIYPRFPADPENTQADRIPAPAIESRTTSGDGHPIEPTPALQERNLETAPALGSSPAELTDKCPRCSFIKLQCICT